MTATIADQPATTLPRKRWTTEEFDRLRRADSAESWGILALRDGEVFAAVEAGAARKRWTIGEVDRLVREGILRDGGPEFLWDGEIITPMPEHPHHINACSNLADELRARLARDAWTINAGHPIDLTEHFMPQPDIVVARGPRSNYRTARPTAADAALVVEVAGTSYHHDAWAYLRHYAGTGIPLYWIIHLKHRRVEVFSGPIPEASRFEHRTDYEIGESVPLVLARGDRAPEYEAIAIEAILRDSLPD